ncbi:MAG: acyl carrier protein [Lachnospiraceae bacterium]|nr:acyl carrier protein [Lachnospiraceae bacterium]
MEREEIMEKVTEIFRDVFDDEELVITDSTNSDDIEDWDSLEHISLIVSMEKEFSLKFDIKQVNQLENVGQMVDLIREMLGGSR